MTARAVVVLLLIASLLGACHTRPPRIDCQGHLSPINTPAPIAPSAEKQP